jgi:hypothetical protein
VHHGRHTQPSPGRLQGQGRPGGRQADQDRRRLAKAYQVHPVQISQWKKQLLDGVETLFRDGRRREREEGQAVQAELYEKIGRLNMEIEWLKKRVARCG